jgi:hypothetical protein
VQQFIRCFKWIEKLECVMFIRTNKYADVLANMGCDVTHDPVISFYEQLPAHISLLFYDPVISFLTSVPILSSINNIYKDSSPQGSCQSN